MSIAPLKFGAAFNLIWQRMAVQMPAANPEISDTTSRFQMKNIHQHLVSNLVSDA